MNVPNIKVTPPGPNARKILARDARWLATATKASPLVVKRASGSVVEDVDGNLFIDFTCGVSVTNVGHANPRVNGAIKAQVDAFTHFAGTDFYYDIQTRLAERLAHLAPGTRAKKVFFSSRCSSRSCRASMGGRWAPSRSQGARPCKERGSPR